MLISHRIRSALAYRLSNRDEVQIHAGLHKTGSTSLQRSLALAGLLYPVLILPAASIVAALMAGAIVMHLKVADPFKKSLPAISLLALSLLMMVGRWGA